jgi:hypothetical protein
MLARRDAPVFRRDHVLGSLALYRLRLDQPSFLDPKFHFPFPWFAWLSPLPGSGMYMLFFFLGILSILIVIGLWYRVSAALFFVGFTYVFLLDQSYYLNHFYLLSLLSFLMIFIPLTGTSFDSRNNPGLRSTNGLPVAVFPDRAAVLLRRRRQDQ